MVTRVPTTVPEVHFPLSLVLQEQYRPELIVSRPVSLPSRHHSLQSLKHYNISEKFQAAVS